MEDKGNSIAARATGRDDGKAHAAMTAEPPQPVPTGGILRNILGNLGWLIGGKGFGAVCSIIYLAILARSLGLRDFGHFSLIFGTGQALVAIAGFQIWQTVVRFGAAPLHAGDHQTFGRLSILCGVIDAVGALSGCIIAALIYYGFADALGINPDFVHLAFAFNCAMLWARTTAASGVLRVLDRFDIAAFVEAIVPLGRLLAALAIWAVGPSVGAFLAAWALIDLIAAAVYWVAAWRLAPEAFRRGNLGHVRATIRAHPGLLRFVGITYLSSTLDAVFKQGPLLAVGYFLSTSAAGLYRLADQLAQGLGKLAALLGRAIYSEIARAHVAISAHDFRRLVAQITAIATLGGTIISLVAIFGGRQLLHLVGGEAFTDGHAILVPLAIGSSLELTAIAYEPVLHSAGRAALSLVSRGCAIIAGALAAVALIEYGSPGIGWSVAIGYLSGFVFITSATWWILSKPRASD
jgi:O-antigen/teichoic acid export membrane protein